MGAQRRLKNWGALSVSETARFPSFVRFKNLTICEGSLMRYIKALLLTTILMLPSLAASATSSSITEKLAGTEWKLVSIGKADAPSPVVEGTAVTIKFGADGKVGGSGGCNSYGGDYQVLDDSLSLSKIISTKKACVAQDAMRQESLYFEALGTAGKFKLADNQLTIFYDEGRGALSFTKATHHATAERGEGDGAAYEANDKHRRIACDFNYAHGL
jgi:heat shock protein HslJ